MKINKEGYKIILITGVLCLLLWGMIYYLLNAREVEGVMWLSGIVLVMFWFFIVSFFREPRRVKIHDGELVFAPCDGRVVVTEKVVEDEYFGGREMMQISIFMSITNVHINWYPVGGVIKYFKHHQGRYLVAWHPKSSTENEHTTTVIETGTGDEVMFRQVAGYIARRVVSYMNVGDTVKQNDKCGVIKFGSRMDILVPKDSELLVEIGDPVVGTQTPLARLKKA